jgi:2',3'-cyclic-nucleotide 3'-phosphodiesterase
VPITDETLKEVTRVVQEAGVVLSEETPAGTDAGGRWDGWDGGVIWLVPTDKPIAEWKPIATRQL